MLEKFSDFLKEGHSKSRSTLNEQQGSLQFNSARNVLTNEKLKEIQSTKVYKDIERAGAKAGFDISAVYVCETMNGDFVLSIDIFGHNFKYYDDYDTPISISPDRSYDEKDIVCVKLPSRSKELDIRDTKSFINEFEAIVDFAEFINNYKFAKSDIVILDKEYFLNKNK